MRNMQFSMLQLEPRTPSSLHLVEVPRPSVQSLGVPRSTDLPQRTGPHKAATVISMTRNVMARHYILAADENTDRNSLDVASLIS